MKTNILLVKRGTADKYRYVDILCNQMKVNTLQLTKWLGIYVYFKFTWNEQISMQ